MSTQVLTRTTQLLRQLAISRSEGLRLVELCHLTGLERGTVHRLLKDLIIEGLVSQDHQSKVYFLGIAMFEMGMAVPAMRLRELCRGHLAKLSAETGETTVLTVRSGNDGVCIDYVQGRPVLGERPMQGVRSPLILGVPNMAILSGLTSLEIQKVSLASLSVVGLQDQDLAFKEIEAKVLRTQARGYALQDDTEVMGGVILAVGLPDPIGSIIAAMSIFTAAPVISKANTGQLVAALRLTQKAVAEDLKNMPLSASRK